MAIQNEKNQTLETWRDYQGCELQLDGNQCQRTGGGGQETRSEPFTANRVNWSAHHSISISTGSIDGGILDQLINQTRNQLESLEAYAIKIRQQLQELENLRSRLQNQNESE